MEKIPLEMKELRQWSRGLRLPSDPEKSRTMELNSRCKKWIFNTWHLYQPEWFITLLWNDCPTDPVKASSHTRILRRMMLEKYFGVKNMSKVPEFPDRPGMMTFQERTVSQTGKVTFHTHMHLSNTDGCWESKRDVEEFVRKSGANVKKLLKTTKKGNKGVESIAWHQDHHMYYNLKEHQRQKKITLTRYLQDGDLLLDYENSDLIGSLDKRKHYGHKRISKRSY